jgi:hypothetical protein
MVSLHSHRRASGASIGNQSSIDEAKSDGPEDETTVVEPEQGNGEDIPLVNEGKGC